MEHASIDSGSEEVVGGGDGMDITGQVKVELIHGDDLTVTATGSTTLDTEGGTLTGLADVGKSQTTNVSTKSLGQTHGGGGLALTERGGGDTSNNDVAAVTAVLKTLEDAEVNLGLVSTIRLELRGRETNFGANLSDGLGSLGSGNGDIGRNGLLQLQGKRDRSPLLLVLEVESSGFNDVLQKHGDGHRTDAAGNRSNGGSNLGGRLELDVTDQADARLLGSVLDVVGADINDNGALLEPLALDKVGLTNGGDNNVGLLEVLLEIGSSGVADGNGSVGVLEEVADGAAHDITTTEDNSVLALQLNTGLGEKSHDTLGGAWDEMGVAAALGKLTNVESTETVDILLVGNGRSDVVLGDVLGEGQLDKHAVDTGVVVELDYLGNKLGLGGILVELDQLGLDTAL